MIRAILFSLVVLSPCRSAFAADTSKTDPVERQFAQFDKLVSRYRTTYADTLRLIKTGPSVFVSTSAAALPAAQEKLKVDEELVRRDQEALRAAADFSSAPVKVAPEIDANACGKDFSVDKALASYGSGWTVEQVTKEQELMFSVALYQICSDVAEHAQELCANKSALFDVRPKQPGAAKPDHSENSSYRDECMRGGHNARLIAAGAHGAGAFKAACEQTAAELFAPGKAAEGCGAVAASFDDPPAAAAKVKPFLNDRSVPTSKLAGDLAMVVGKATPAECAAKRSDGFGINAELCSASAALHKARAAGGAAAACGPNAMCKAFLGAGSSACQPYAAQIRNLYCHRGPTAAAKDAPKVDANAKTRTNRNALMEKIKADETELTRQQNYVEGLKAQAGSSAKQSEFMNAVAGRRKELRSILDEAFAIINGVEPKSHAGIDDRRSQIDDLQQDLDSLPTPSTGAPAPKSPRRKKAKTQ